MKMEEDEKMSKERIEKTDICSVVFLIFFIIV